MARPLHLRKVDVKGGPRAAGLQCCGAVPMKEGENGYSHYRDSADDRGVAQGMEGLCSSAARDFASCRLAVGIVIGASGGNLEQALPVGILLEIACIGVLIRLAARGPSPAPAPSLSHDYPAVETPANVV